MRSNKPQAQTAQKRDVQDFIAGAEKKAAAHPWEAPGVRPDMNKVFNVRLPEDMFLKLKYISENQRRRSMQSICLDAIEPYIERELEKVLQAK
ncbi:MAG: hypothetical protein ACPGSM_20375 [Thiolinea sp.]